MSEPKQSSFTNDELTEALRQLRGWTYDRGRRALHRRVEMPDFPQALAFMLRIGIEAEKRDHHPEWANVYNRVDIWLTTHAVQGVSDKDAAMARHIDTIIGERT
jgi:4a-hydroxytetrahydrobiopterin dehydratase